MWRFAATFAVMLAALKLANADDGAAQVLLASHECVAAYSVEIGQTVEQSVRLVIDGKPSGGLQTTRQSSTIEMDVRRGLVRMTSKDASGKELVVLRKGKKVAMRIGSGPWTPPQGAYSHMAEQMGNPFACPLPKAGDKLALRWKTVGPERLDGVETTVIETVGDSANEYAAERMQEGIASLFPDAGTRPATEVLAYKARHWIGAKDGRRLRVEQTSHIKMKMPGTGNMVMDATGKTISNYSRYDAVQIEVPTEARPIIDAMRN